MFILKLVLVLLIQDLDTTPGLLQLMVAELQKELVLEDIRANDEQKVKLRLLDKRQRQTQKAIVQIQIRLVDSRREQLSEEVNELTEELKIKKDSMRAQGIKMLEGILDERQLARTRQIVNWQRCREHGKTNLVVGICSDFGSKLLGIDGKERYQLKNRFARNQADFIDQVIGYRRSMESVISAEKLKPIWGSDYEVRLSTIESSEALNYIATNFQGSVVAETVVGSIHHDAKLAIEKLAKRNLPTKDQQRMTSEILESAYKRLVQKIDEHEFRRLSRRFLRKSLQDFKNGRKLGPDAATYFALSQDEVTQARSTYNAWKRSRNEEYANFQRQQLEEFKTAISRESLKRLDTHFGDLPKSALAYFEQIDH